MNFYIFYHKWTDRWNTCKYDISVTKNDPNHGNHPANSINDEKKHKKYASRFGLPYSIQTIQVQWARLVCIEEFSSIAHC